jgi:hypothetical protein
MIRASLIGPGNIDFHYSKILKIPLKKLKSEIEKISKILAESNLEIELTPDKGIALEIAKEYKKFGGEKVIASVPKDDKVYGIKHLEPYLKIKLHNEKLFDKEINTGDWRQQNRLKALLGDAVLILGMSSGTNIEMNYGIYLYKLINKMKKGINNAKYLHPEVRAGKNIPYTFLIYSPFLKNKKLSPETEAYMKKYGIKLIYIKNSKELKKELKKLK